MIPPDSLLFLNYNMPHHLPNQIMIFARDFYKYMRQTIDRQATEILTDGRSQKQPLPIQVYYAIFSL
jgi:hypothetical protein